jgi:hypothetical protein
MAEEHKERIDRELIEMLNEIRVALPGVQVLFAFLLILPFQQGFERVTEVDRLVYFLGLLSTAAASALLIAPSSYHRLRFRSGTQPKEQMLFTSNRLIVAGLFLVAVGITCSIYLLADVLFGELVALVAALVSAAWFGWFWYGLPLSRPSSPEEDDA